MNASLLIEFSPLALAPRGQLLAPVPRHRKRP